MHLDATSLIVSMVLGSIGLVLFSYGKRQQRLPYMVTGGILLVYPYFVPSVVAMALIGVALLLVCWLSVRFFGL